MNVGHVYRSVDRERHVKLLAADRVLGLTILMPSKLISAQRPRSKWVKKSNRNVRSLELRYRDGLMKAKITLKTKEKKIIDSKK